MSTYPYVLYPTLLLEFMAAPGEIIDFNVKDRVRREEQYAAVSELSSQLPWKRSRKWVQRFTVVPAWTKLRHILVLLPGIILSLAAIMGWMLSGALGELGWLVLVTCGLGGAALLWLIADIDGGQSLEQPKSQKLMQKPFGERVDVQNKGQAPLDSRERCLRLKQLRLTLHQRVRQPVGVSDAPVGASERAFLAVLERHFPGRVQTQLKFPVTIKGKEYAYSIDFAIIFPEIGLSIDCEIDEPYDYKSKKPTHCIDQQSDGIRNQYFVEGNWLVIRFSEAQIVLYPDSCCKTIAKVISRITGSKRLLIEFADVSDLKPTPMWTKRQARRMVKARVRERYLSRRNVLSSTLMNRAFKVKTHRNTSST